MAAKVGQDRVEVNFEDQQRINTFSRLNTKMHDFEAQLKARKKFMEDLEEASDELMLSDEESVRFTIGDCFVHLEKDQADDRLAEVVQECQKDVSHLESEIQGIKDQLQDLKAQLYAKFKDSINLEE